MGDLRKGRPASKFPARLIRTWLGHSLELKGYALRIENMPNPVNRGSNKPAQRKGSQVTSRVARKWIGLADAGEWGRAWLPAQAPGHSRTMGFCEQLFSAATVSPLRETALVFSRAITPLTLHHRVRYTFITEFVTPSSPSSLHLHHRVRAYKTVGKPRLTRLT